MVEILAFFKTFVEFFFLISHATHIKQVFFHFVLCIFIKIYYRTLKTHHLIFALVLQTIYAIEELLAGFNVQPRIGMK